jgi:hypothetical protein
VRSKFLRVFDPDGTVMVRKNSREPPMPSKDAFDPNHPLPLFLTGQGDEYRQPRTSPILKASLLVIAVTASGLAIALWLGNPLTVFAEATASLTDNSAAQREANQSTPAIQASADTQPSAPTPADTPPPNEIAAVPEPANQAQTESTEPPPSEALFKEFQAWAAKENERAQNSAQPEPTAPAQVEQDSAPSEQPMQRHRKPRSVQNARAEIRHIRKSKARIQPEQNAAAQPAPAQDARAQDPSMQSAQAPSFLESLGLRR